MKRYAITISCLLAAVVLYALGAALPAGILVLAGAAFEVAFWLRLIGRPGRNRRNT